MGKCSDKLGEERASCSGGVFVDDADRNRTFERRTEYCRACEEDGILTVTFGFEEEFVEEFVDGFYGIDDVGITRYFRDNGDLVGGREVDAGLCVVAFDGDETTVCGEKGTSADPV